MQGDVVHGDELCIRDPGGDGRVTVADTDSDHAPPHDLDAVDRMLAPVADTLMTAARLRTGEAVLDIGCGCGATTLLSGDAVGPDGRIDSVDLTPEMLGIARARLGRAGLGGVAFVEADAQTHPFVARYDAAISGFGTMFFGDPVAAFANIRGALRPGGRLCITTWQPLEANAWLVIPGAALLHWITRPDVAGGGPGMFAQSDPAVVTAILHDAGYQDIDIASVKLALPFGADAAAATDLLANLSVGRAVFDAVRADARPAAPSAVQASLAEHADAHGVRLGAAVLLTTATA